MSNNTSCNNCECDDDLGLPIGATGSAGLPAFIALNYMVAGSPFVNSTASYKEAGRFIFSNTIATPFDSMKTNVWVSGGTGSLEVFIYNAANPAGLQVYQNAAITSTLAYNVETITGQSFYNAANTIIAVRVKAGAGQSIKIGSSIFYYD